MLLQCLSLDGQNESRWIMPSPKPTRPEALRQLARKGLGKIGSGSGQFPANEIK